MNKPTKPTNLMPRSFGGIKNNFSQSLQNSGYEDGIPAIYGGDNLNYQLDATGKELDYCEKIVDFIVNMPIGKTIVTDANNNLVYGDLIQELPIATTENVGVVKPDGTTITIEPDGTISAESINRYLVYANVNGSTWYRVYSDGWKEQGGCSVSSPSEYSWGFIPLTSNGVMGQDAFAVDANVTYSTYSAYKAFNGVTSGAGNGWWSMAQVPVYIEFYSDTPIRVTNLNIQNYGGASTTLSNYFASRAGAVLGSNDGINWTQIKQYTNDTVAYKAKWNINLSDNTNYYNYYRVTSTQISGTYLNEGWYIQEMKITAYAQGGGATEVLYPFSFSDTNYTALLTPEGASDNGLYIASKSEDGLVFGNAPSGKINWYVCGY